MRRILVMLCAWSAAAFLVGSHPLPTAAGQWPHPAVVFARPPAPRPHPQSCPGGGGADTPSGDPEPPVCCVQGRVLSDGVALADALVTLTVSGKRVTTTTAAPPPDAEPYFVARLDQPPLVAHVDDLVIVTVRFVKSAHIVAETSFHVRPGSQQVDIVLAR